MKRVTAKELQEYVNMADIHSGDAGDPQSLLCRLVETLRYYDNMSGDKFRAPNLGNATNVFIIDELGTIRDEIKPRQTYEKVLSGHLKNQIEQALLNFSKTDNTNNKIEGDNYVGTATWVSKLIMDSEAIKLFCTDQAAFIARLGRNPTLEDFQKPSEYWEIRTKPKTPG